MCMNPMGILGIAFQAFSAFSGYAAENEAARAQEEANRRHAENIRKAAIANYAALNERREQDRDSTVEAMTSINREALLAKETAITAAGEAGVSGLSVDALYADFEGARGRAVQSHRRNFENQSSQIDREMEAAQHGAGTQLASLPVVERPSFIGAAVRAVGGVFKGVQSGSSGFGPRPSNIPNPST